MYQGEAAYRRGDYLNAEDRGRVALRRLNYQPGTTTAADHDPELLISALELVASVRRELTDFIQAATIHQQAIAVLDGQVAGPRRDRLRIVVLSRLGETLRLLGRYAEAEHCHRDAVTFAGDLQPADPVLFAQALNGLGIVFKDTGRFTDAAHHYQQALGLLTETLGPDHPELAGLFHNLAGLEHAQGNFAEGEPYARRALELRAKAEESTSPGTASDLTVLGALLLGQCRYAEAESILVRSLAIWQNRFGQQYYEVAIVQHNLAALYAARGEHEQARRSYEEVLRIKLNVLGANHPEVTALHRHIAELPS